MKTSEPTASGGIRGTSPSVSVVIPSYNHRAYIGEAIESVRAQDHQPIQLVVIDDGSSDGSPDYLRERFGTAIDRLIARENQGAHATLNEAIGLSSGEWVAILNSDDIYDPSRISRLLEFAAQERCDLVFSNIHLRGETKRLPEDHRIVRAHERVVAAAKADRSIENALLCMQFAVTTSNFLMTRAAFERVGPFRPFRYCHDWDFLLRAIGKVRIGFLDEKLLDYRIHGRNTISEPGRWRHMTEPALIYADFLANPPERFEAELFTPDFVLYAKKFAPMLVSWLTAEIRRVGSTAIMEELADGTLPRRMEAAFARSFPACDPRFNMRQLSRRSRKSMVRRLLERLLHRPRG